MSKPRKKPLGNRNIIGHNVTSFRKAQHMKQKELAAKLQSMGMDIAESGLSRLECQDRLVQDFELPILAKALGVKISDLLDSYEE